ncbi:MAG: hypothetical protein FJY10_03800, partial [Bacteroidetes bacterium]|nr:hypothetical protein [Bacteroidota bacterium]
MLILIANGYAQSTPVNITIAIVPPYSTKLDDYTSQPGKVLAILLNTSTTSRDVFLRGIITGEGGIKIFTDPAYKMSRALTLLPGISYQLTPDNIQQVFDANHLVFQGITKNDVIHGNGLPEGDYFICLRAFDYTTNQPVSGEEPLGCSNNFTISDIEPPVILNPHCGDEIAATTPQLITFSWTRPPGAPINTRFNLKIIEVLPTDRNINDAMRSAVHPVFFEKTLTINTFIFGPAEPALVTGKKYAFAVTAIDPANKFTFRNKGMSEVCSFDYKEGLQIIYTIDTTIRIKPELIGIDQTHIITFPPFVTNTIVTGKMIYRYFEADQTKTFPLGLANLKLVVTYLAKDNNGNFSSWRGNLNGYIPEKGYTLATATTGTDGNFKFIFLNNDIQLGLVAEDIKIMEGQVADLYRAVTIKIENPHKEFYLDPDNYFFFNSGDNYNTGTLTSKVRSYQLKITLRPNLYNDPELKFLQNDRQTLNGVTVYLCRKVDFSYSLFPLEDGIPEESQGDKFKVPGLVVVAKTSTDLNGLAVFRKIVWNHNPNYRYYLYAETDPTAELNYSFGTPIPFDPALPSVNTGQNYIITPTDPSEYLNVSTYIYPALEKMLIMEAEMPKVTGQVLDLKEAKPVAGTKVTLAEFYKFKLEDFIWPLYSPFYGEDENTLKTKFSACPYTTTCYHHLNKYYFTGSDGKFYFEHRPILMNLPNKMLLGPERTVWAYCPGYNSQHVKVKNGAPLSFGEQVYMTFQLPSGAKIKGRVIDGETNQGIQAYFRFSNDTQGGSTNSSGYFSNYPAKYLPSQEQLLIVEAEGYLTDTIKAKVWWPDTDLGNISLYTKKRRLDVLVVESQTNKRIVGAKVEILEVTGTCIKTQGNYKMYYPCPLNATTNVQGAAEFAFENAGDDNNVAYTVRVTVPDNFSNNYEGVTISTKIPYSQSPKFIVAYLRPAACMKGKVYAGITDSALVAGALVKMDVTGSFYGFVFDIGDLQTKTDATGNYILRNVPVRNYSQTIRAVKSQSQYIGDSIVYTINKASNQCIEHDFHLKVYNDMDITNLMGFPIYVTNLKPGINEKTALINGSFTDIPGNEQFAAPGQELKFHKIAIHPALLKNEKGIPVAEPDNLPVKTEDNQLPMKIYTAYYGFLKDNKIGIYLDKMTQNSLYGVIKGKVSVSSTSFNTTGFSLPDLGLALNSGSNPDKLMIPAFNADKTVSKPSNVPLGFYVCDLQGNSLRFGFAGFTGNAAEVDLEKSFLKADQLILNTILHTNISGIIPSDLKIKLGDVIIKTNEPFLLNGNSPVTLKLGEWPVLCNDWKLNNTGLKLNKSIIQTGVDVQCDNIKITSSALMTDQVVVHLDKVKLLGIKDLIISAPNKGLNYVNYNGQMHWQIYATASSQQPIAGYMDNIPGLAPADQIQFTLIRLVDNNERTFTVRPSTFKLFNLIDFTPNAGTNMNVYSDWFKIRGYFKLGYPSVDGINGNIAYSKEGNTLKFNLDNMDKISFWHKKLLTHLNAISLSYQLFIAKGTSEEENQLLPVHETLRHTPTGVKIDIDPGEKISISSDNSRYFDQVVGGMKVVNNAWETYWFEGEMIGAKGISENHQRLKFFVDGAITASDQTIKVSEMEDFPGMSWA